jgi:hypothetical protein
LKGKIIIKKKFSSINRLYRLVDIILEKMSDAPEDPSGPGQGNNAYGNQPGAYNKGTARLTATEQQDKGNPCQC